MGAVVFVVGLAVLALQACLDLSTDTNTVPDLDGGYSFSDLDGLPDDFVANTDGQGAVTPPASDGVNIGAADTARFNLDVDVTVFEWLWLELMGWSTIGRRYIGGAIFYFLLLEISPFCLILDHEALESVWVAHVD